MNKPITRKDVARLANVSEQTVSYIFNGSRKFAKKTVDAVMRVVEETGYKPDEIAKSLVKRRSNTVAILLHDFTNPIFGEIMMGFQKKAYELGYFVFFADFQDKTAEFISDLEARRVEGVYVTLREAAQYEELFNRLKMSRIKTVLGNKVKNSDKNVLYVETDKNIIMRKIILYLKEKGHKKIAYLSGLDIHNPFDERYSAFIEQYTEMFNDEPVVIENSAPFDTSIESGKELAIEFLKNRGDVTAIVTTNDLMAIGAIESIKNAGLSVPDDISVIGNDNIQYSKYVDPPLTTVSFDKQAYGERVFEILKSKIENKAVESVSEDFSSIIIERSSVKSL